MERARDKNMTERYLKFAVICGFSFMRLMRYIGFRVQGLRARSLPLGLCCKEEGRLQVL